MVETLICIEQVLPVVEKARGSEDPNAATS